jgi:hypothetical protein
VTIWKCEECGLPNHDAAHACEVCGTRRTGEPGTGAAPPPVSHEPREVVREHEARPASRRTAVRPPPPRAFPAVPVALIGAFLVLLLAGGAWALTGDETPGQGAGDPPTVSYSSYPVDVTQAPPPTSDEPPAPVPTTAGPTPSVFGLVSVEAPLYDQRVQDVARMFDGHFRSINSRDYATAAGYFDPSGVVDPNQPAQVAAFADDVSTTQDSEIVLHSVTDGPQGSQVLAHVTFSSEQAAGRGPHGRESETCTRWEITYLLSSWGAGDYRIIRAATATSEPCYS